MQAYKAYLRVLEMSATPGSAATAGPTTRALWGLKLVSAKLLASKGSEGEQVEAVEAMATDLLLNRSYKGSSRGVQVTRDAARKVLS